ncbi:MAG: hypothetical protein K2W95_26520 [Candidatus Obscuribacterales bacterium]|nr:hypothetical protein [Candidatus Obscuribacterales bacterium]
MAAHKKQLDAGIVFLIIALCAPLPAHAQNDAALSSARELFQRYIELERNFDVAQGELYAPDARVKNTRLYPGGQNQVISLSGAEYRRLLRAALPLAKGRNDQSQYSAITYQKEGNGVRIKCTRFSQLKQYSSPLEIVVAPVGGTWLITSESSQSKP